MKGGVASARVTASAVPSTSRPRERISRAAQRGDQSRAAPRGALHAESALPQLAQNFAPGAADVPHWVQCVTLGALIAVPQLEQNLAPGGFIA